MEICFVDGIFINSKASQFQTSPSLTLLQYVDVLSDLGGGAPVCVWCAAVSKGQRCNARVQDDDDDDVT